MSNHFHLLLRTGTIPISFVMRKLLTGYAVTFNLRHRRHGHLFQNRYKSILCQEDRYLMELVRYIHLNPLRAGIVQNYDELCGYQYCGHSVLLGRQKNDWQDTEYVLRFFDDKLGAAKKEYKEFVEKGIDQGSRPDLVGGGLLRSCGGWIGIKELRDQGIYQKGDERILGDGGFVEQVLSESQEKFERKYELKKKGIDLTRVRDEVAKILKIDPDKVTGAGKQKDKVLARSIFCYWVTQELGKTQSELANYMKMTQPAVCQAVRRGADLVRENKYKMGIL